MTDEIINFDTRSRKDKIEITKQQIEEIQLIFDRTIKPHKNHILYEVNLIDQTIEQAEFEYDLEIHWDEAIKGVTSKKKVIQKENCLYIPAMNKRNVIKILKRDHGIHITI